MPIPESDELSMRVISGVSIPDSSLAKEIREFVRGH